MGGPLYERNGSLGGWGTTPPILPEGAGVFDILGRRRIDPRYIEKLPYIPGVTPPAKIEPLPYIPGVTPPVTFEDLVDRSPGWIFGPQGEERPSVTIPSPILRRWNPFEPLFRR